MSDKNVLRSVALASAMLLLGCAVTSAAQSIESIKQKATMESLSVEAYQRIVPRLSELKAGDRIQSKIEWDVFPIVDRQGKRKDLVAVLDGWVGPLSGGLRSALGGFGRLVGQTGDVLFGEHVFGYLLGMTLKPQYVVFTQATVISEDEFKLRDKKADDYGSVDAAVAVDLQQKREERTRIYYKDLRVKETRQLKFTQPDELEGLRLGERKTIADMARSHVTIERFKEAEKKLESLAPGTDYWEILIALNMFIITLDSGVTYRAWLADGYLGQAWEKLTPGGNFRVLRFGYFQDNDEVPKLALIFKNGRVHKLVPHGTQEEVERNFD